MKSLELLLASMLFGATVDLPAGTILCKSQSSADALVEAVRSRSDGVEWLMSGACERIDIDLPNQNLLRDEPMQVVRWTNGAWQRDRIVIPAVIANRIEAGRLADTRPIR